MRRRFSVPLSGLGLGTAAGAGALAWAAGYEVRAFRLRHVETAVLPPGSPPLRVLHLSDLHLTPGQARKRAWLRGLADLQPDLVVNTGDNLAHREAVPALLDALDPLLERPGVFVMGSNDYYAPVLKNPLRYLLPDDGKRNLHAPRLPTEDLRAGLVAAGWLDLNNRRDRLKAGDAELDVVGTDDAHIRRDRYGMVAGSPDPAADFGVAVTHAPYRRVIDPMTLDGWPLILAGHTHGGQVCLPGFGALVTNCDLPRRQAAGLSEWRSAGRTAALHVSAGLGTSPYAPIRFACPPEATLLTLLARPS